jgi:hypothetical protein
MSLFLKILFSWCAGYCLYLICQNRLVAKKELTDKVKEKEIFGAFLTTKGANIVYFLLHIVTFFIWPYYVFIIIRKKIMRILKRIIGYFIRKKADDIFVDYMSAETKKNRFLSSCAICYYLKKEKYSIQSTLVNKTVSWMDDDTCNKLRPALHNTSNQLEYLDMRPFAHETLKRDFYNIKLFLSKYRELYEDYDFMKELDIKYSKKLF